MVSPPSIAMARGEEATAIKNEQLAVHLRSESLHRTLHHQVFDSQPRRESLPEEGQNVFDSSRIQKLVANISRRESLPEERQNVFDSSRIQKLVANISRFYGMPNCCIALENSDAVRVKATRGFSMCASIAASRLLRPAQLRKVPIIIYDAAEDDRFIRDPVVVQEPKARFVILQSLQWSPGKYIGTLCLMSPTPVDSFSINDCSALSDCAEAIMEEYRKLSSVSMCQAKTVGSLDSYISSGGGYDDDHEDSESETEAE